MDKQDSVSILKDIRARMPEGADADHWIVDQIGINENIQRDVRRLDQEEREAHEALKAKLADIRRRRDAMRSRCNHVFRHYGDPAGGYASFDECVICGK